jgi:hypothetical protein
MPEQKVNTFIRTRDKSSVYELQKVLKDMERSNGSSDGGRSSPLERSASAPCSQLSRGSSSLSRRQNSQARLRDMGTLRTAYSDTHGELGLQVGGSPPKAKTPKHAFKDMIKSRVKPVFEEWKEGASDSQVRVLADTCRSLRWLSAEAKAPTTYSNVHADFPNHKTKPPPEKDNSRNVSVGVPLGSIYKQSEQEALVAKMAMVTHQERLAAATRQQAEWRDGTRTMRAASPEGGAEMSHTYSTPPLSTMKTNMQEVCKSVRHKSLAQESWPTSVHSSIQVKRHGHYRISPGETDWNMCGMTGNGISERIYDLKNPKLFPGGGNPHRGRLVTSKMAHFGEAASLRHSSSTPAF